jgi:hypothetical protein
LIEEGKGAGEEASWPSCGLPACVHYLITRREVTGFEAPYTFFRCGEGVLPLFCSREAARSFLASRALGEGWHVRVFSVGELISLLFAFHERVAWVSFSPLPGHQLIEDALSHLTSRDSFIESLVVR